MSKVKRVLVTIGFIAALAVQSVAFADAPLPSGTFSNGQTQCQNAGNNPNCPPAK